MAEAHAWRHYVGMFPFFWRFLRLFPGSVEQPLAKSSPLKLHVICCLVAHYKVFYCVPLSAHAEAIVDFELNQKLELEVQCLQSYSEKPELAFLKPQRKDIQVPSLCEEVCKGILSH